MPAVNFDLMFQAMLKAVGKAKEQLASDAGVTKEKPGMAATVRPGLPAAERPRGIWRFKFPGSDSRLTLSP
ncbi:hypothetical protein DPM13_09615 [Paracoccus mutanolyticus]|uniref:HK97 gp10 family phage protein n=1 Tax=Paracoccus mutanolyticus TaxID=1499308 RepID=A0ABM6WRH1_9RHOB|nr:hypothetical protein [Paracoccus mutanolyticus]AWX93274.1 hypothetical protein DPM13_09615 [Paracoccus mutanolyticus]